MQDFNQGNALHREGQLEPAAAAYRRAIAAQPDHAQAHNNLGAVLVDQGRIDEAAAAYRRVVDLKPDHAKGHLNLGVVLQIQGHLDEAALAFRRAIALQPDYAKAYYNLANQGGLSDGTPQADATFELLRRQTAELDRFGSDERSLLLFALGKALEDRGDYDAAFACLSQANTLFRADLSFDIAKTEGRLRSTAEVFESALFERLAGIGLESERPIFIVGMARSGTTLVEQVLSAHPDVYGAGEIPNLAALVASIRGADGSTYPHWAPALTEADRRLIGQAYLDSLPAAREARVTDKTLSNLEHLGLLHLCLPHARFIHCRRDPRDVAWSCFASRFSDRQDYAYDLTELGRYWRAYEGLVAHWRAVLPPGRIFEAPYEDLVQDVEGWARRLIAHCGLPWDEACLRFNESGREVATGSFAQVRRPIYAGSVGRWSRFASHLGPLMATLDAPAAGGD
ncbi:MAG: tetratricopeptide repeat-containing sulfotransferase family protein [Caulobacteraceae bacterium]